MEKKPLPQHDDEVAEYRAELYAGVTGVQPTNFNPQGTQGSQPNTETQQKAEELNNQKVNVENVDKKVVVQSQVPTPQDAYNLAFQPLSSCLKYSENSNEVLPNGFQLSELVQSQIALTHQASDNNFLAKLQSADEVDQTREQQQDNVDQILAQQLNLQAQASSILAHEVDANDMFANHMLDNDDDLVYNDATPGPQPDLCFQGNQGNI